MAYDGKGLAMKAQQLQDALDQAFEEAEVPATDRPKAKDAFDKASTLKLGDEEALNRAFRAIGTPKEKAEAGKKRFVELKKLYETKKHQRSTPSGRFRGLAIAVIATVLVVLALVVFATMMAPDGSPSTSAEPTATTEVRRVYVPPDGTPVGTPDLSQ
jgi:hypothetical protein